jgi:hypothetical protein
MVNNGFRDPKADLGQPQGIDFGDNAQGADCLCALLSDGRIELSTRHRIR